MQRAVAAAVLHRRARFQPMHADRLEREVEHQLGAFLNTPVPQNGDPMRKAPLGRAEARLELAHLEDPDGGVEALERDREAGIGAGRALTHGSTR